jgi:hypothetical protein
LLNEIDLFVGRKTPRMLREAGLIDIQVEPIARISPQKHGHRTSLLHFAKNLHDRLLAHKIVTEKQLADLVREVNVILMTLVLCSWVVFSSRHASVVPRH